LTLSTYNKMKKRRDAWKEKTVKAKTSLRRKKKRITESRRSVINTSGNYAWVFWSFRSLILVLSDHLTTLTRRTL